MHSFAPTLLAALLLAGAHLRAQRLVADLNTAPAWPGCRTLGAPLTCGNQVFFTADDWMHGSELFASDGTAAGTRMVLDSRPGPGGILFPIASNGGVVLTTDQASLWRSDGTPARTRSIGAAFAEGPSLAMTNAIRVLIGAN